MSLHEHVGRVVDERYILNQRVGSGATGVVFRATQKVVDREVAVKLLNRNATDDPNYRSRFEREAKVLGRLDHEGFVRVFDFGWYAELNQPYLVTEFVQGLPLSDVTDELSPRQFLEVVAKVCSALQHAHEKGIAHRDLKPGNILIPYDHNTDGTKVVDFGLAAILDNESIRVTQKGDAFGTPAYMSPEQCVGDEEIGPATDVYSLGCWMFEYFEGELPYAGSTASRVMIKHVTRPVPKLSDTTLPAPLVEIVAQMMEKSADDRPTMGEVGERVAELLRTAQGRASWLAMPRTAKPPQSGADPTIRTTRPVPYVERYIAEQFPDTSLSKEATTVAFEDVEDVEDVATSEDDAFASMENGFFAEVPDGTREKVTGLTATTKEPEHLRSSFFAVVSTRRVPVALALLAAVGVALVAWMMLRGDSALATAAPTEAVAQEVVAEEVIAEELAPLPTPAEEVGAEDVARAVEVAQSGVSQSIVVPTTERPTAKTAKKPKAKTTASKTRPTESSATKPAKAAESATTAPSTPKSRPSAKLRY